MDSPFNDPLEEQQGDEHDIFAADPHADGDGDVAEVFGSIDAHSGAGAGPGPNAGSPGAGGAGKIAAEDDHAVEAAPPQDAAHAGSEDPFTESYDTAGDHDHTAPADLGAGGMGIGGVGSEIDDFDTKVPESTLPDVDTPLAKWEAERKNVLAKRMADAQVAKQNARAQAEVDIADFYKQRKETLQKTQMANRVEEKNMKADLEALLKHGTEWEKVAKLVNLQAKNSEARNVDRLRKLLVQLKNDKDTSMFQNDK